MGKVAERVSLLDCDIVCRTRSSGRNDRNEVFHSTGRHQKAVIKQICNEQQSRFYTFQNRHRVEHQHQQEVVTVGQRRDPCTKRMSKFENKPRDVLSKFEPEMSRTDSG
jgi:hypothetical protein